VLLIGHLATRWSLDHFVNGVPLEDLVRSEFHWQEGWQYHVDATTWLDARRQARPRS
jgi:alpha-ribazole phosphatase/probable phosphoglycerate mutase